MATDPITIAPPAPPQPASDPNASVYDAIRRADAAGDADAVARLSLYLKQQQAPAPITDSGTTMGFAQDAPTEASRQLSAEDSATFYKMLRGDGMPKASAAELRHFVGSKGLSLDNAEQIVEQRDKGQGVVGQITYPLPKVENTDGPAATTARGAMDTLTFGTLPKLGAGIAGIESAVKGDGFLDKYHEMLDHNNGVIASDQAEHPYYRVAGQLLAGLAIPTGLEGVGYRAGSAALREGASLQEARGVAMAAVRNRMAITGGAYGAAHGAGSADDIPDAIKGAATEGALGATAGLAFGAAGQYLDPAIQASRVAARALPLSDAQRTFAAADRQGIDVLPADVGGPTVRRLTAAAAQAPISASPVIDAAQATVHQAQGARDRIATTIGQILDPEAAGQGVRQGALQAIQTTGADVRGAYTAAERAAGDARIRPSGALNVLDRNIRELSDVPGGAPSLARLQGLRDALVDPETGNQIRDFSVGGLRNMRTVLRQEFIRDGLRGSDTERRVNQVLDAAQHDIANGLPPNAAAMFTRADNMYRERVDLIDNVLKPLIGTRDAPKSGEQIIKTLTADLQGNNARAVRFLNALPQEEQANTRASIIGALGRQAPGAQNVEGDGFSLSKFLTDWNKIGETAKRGYFGNESRAALNDLARVAQGTKGAQGYANHSNSAGGIWGNLGAILGSGGTLSGLGHPVAGVLTTVGTLGGQVGMGRLLASPRFARWLARAPRTSLGSAAYLDRLTRIARAEPAIANDVLQLQSRLSEMLGSAPQRAAADDKRDKQ
jgi:hypothetical protein